MPRYGEGGGGFDDMIRRAQEAKPALDDVRRKDEQRQAVEERGIGLEGRTTAARSDVAAATKELSSALTQNIGRLTSETEAIAQNTAAWARNAEARGRAQGGTLSGVARSTRAPAAAVIHDDPGAQARYESALVAQEAATSRARAATTAYGATARPSSTATSEERVSLLAAQEEAKRQLAFARQETAAAQRGVEAQVELATQRTAATEELRRVNAANAREGAIQESINYAAAQELREREAALSRLGAATLGTTPGLSGGARGYLATAGIESAVSGIPRAGLSSLGPEARASLATPPGLAGGGIAAAGAAEQSRAVASAEESRAAAAVAAHEEHLRALAQTQRQVNQEYNASVAAYANSSSALSRHGALTTEFIQAFSRGQVTLKEFESQMLSTIGKFAGWAVAAGLVYGAFNALKDLGSGAAQTQTGVAQLSRFIPGLGGPAGGGNAQIPAAESTLRDISTQFNVPIKEVVDSMQVMARVFHTVSSAGDATRAVLAAVKLDQIPVEQAQQYLTGIGQSLNIQSGHGLEGVVNSLNALQNTLGARVAQTLPALARAAPAAQAGGLDTPTLEALVAIGVRAGITGPQVGTALLRSIGTFAFRPQSEAIFQGYGIQAKSGEYGDLIKQITHVIDTRKDLTGTDLRNLAQALGGPLLGTRTLLPLLEQEQLHPGAIDRARGTAANPPSYQKDLDTVLSTISERFKSLGIAIQNFGSFLASSGALAPLIAGFDVIGGVVHALEALLSPLVSVIGVFNQLPGVVRDAIGAFVGYKIASAAYNTTFGSTAQGFVGRLPGLSALDSEPRAAIRGTLGRLETYALPEDKANQERADRALLQAKDRQRAALDAVAKYDEVNAAGATARQGSAANDAYREGRAPLASASGAANRAAQRAEDNAAQAGVRLAQTTSDIAVLRDRRFTTEQKTAYLELQGLTQQQELVNLNAQYLKLAQDRIAGIVPRGGGGPAAPGAAAAVAAAGAGAGAAASAAEVAAIAGAAAAAKVFDPATAAAFRSPRTPAAAYEQSWTTRADAAELLGLGGGQGALDRLRRVPGAVGGALSGAAYGAFNTVQQGIGSAPSNLKEFLGSGTAPFAGLIASQLLGSAVGGSVGGYISGVGGSAASGALLAQLLGKTGAGLAGGAALGAIAGNFQQGTTQGLASVAGGGIGAGIGALVGGGVPGALIGGAIGSTVGGVVGDIFGGKPQTEADKQKAAQDAARKANQNTQNIQQFGDQFAQDLEAAFSGTGDAATKAQTKIETQVRELTATLKAFGSGSRTGQAAIAQLNQVIQAATADQSLSPDKAGQIIQTAQQGILTSVNDRFKYTLATGGVGSGPGALATANAGYAQAQAGFAQAQQAAAQQVQDAQGLLTQAQAKGSAPAVAAATSGVAAAEAAAKTAHDKYGQDSQEFKDSIGAVAKAQKALDAAASRGAGATVEAAKAFLKDAQDRQQRLADQSQHSQEAITLAQQAQAQAVYQQQTQVLGANTTLAQASAGGDKTKQLQAQLQQQTQLGNLAGSAGLDPTTAYIDQTNAAAKARDIQTQLVQQNLAELKSKQGVVAAGIPSYDTVGAAQQNLASLQQQYQYIQANKSAFDPSQVNDALSAVIKAKEAVASAARDFATQMNDIQGQIAQARAAGDAVAQAQIGIQTATNDLALAGKDPRKIAQAQLNQVNAANALHTATVSRISSQAALAKAQDPNDAVGNAQIDINAARSALANARGIDEQIAAQAQLANAQDALNKALQGRIIAEANLKASQTTDPLQKLREQIAGAAQALASAQGPDAKISAATNLNNLKQQYQQTLVSERQTTIDFQLSMQQITTQQAIQKLQDLLKLKDLSVAERQSIEQKIRQLQLGAGTSGQFDLAPGNIKLPTPLDVRAAINKVQGQLQAGLAGAAAGGPLPPGAVVNPGGRIRHAGLLDSAATSHIGNIDARTAISIIVGSNADIGKVADAIDRTTGSQLRARLRAAGIRGT